MSNDPFSDDFNGPDPTDPHSYSRERAEVLRKRYGSDSEPWDKDFGGLDTSAAQGRKASKELKDIIASAGKDPDRPLSFSMRVANRSVPIQVKEEGGVWSCNMPVLTTGWSGVPNYEWRRVEVRPPEGYDELIATINRLANAGPSIHDLTAEQELELARNCMPPTKENLAYVMERYLTLRLGPGANESSLSDPRYTHVVDEMVLFLMKYSVPDYPNTPQVINYIRKFAAGRPLNYKMAKAAFEQFKKEQKTAEQLAPPQVSEAQLEKATDKELSETFVNVRRAYAQAERDRRALLHNDRQYRTPQEAIQAAQNEFDQE